MKISERKKMHMFMRKLVLYKFDLFPLECINKESLNKFSVKSCLSVPNNRENSAFTYRNSQSTVKLNLYSGF